MIRIGLLRETKIPADNRVAFTPGHCKHIQQQFPNVRVTVQASPDRCFNDREYRLAGIEVKEN
ncbi:MAG: alanine dehydrogenase, partial [Flavitalea sp.]